MASSTPVQFQLRDEIDVLNFSHDVCVLRKLALIDDADISAGLTHRPIPNRNAVHPQKIAALAQCHRRYGAGMIYT